MLVWYKCLMHYFGQARTKKMFEFKFDMAFRILRAMVLLSIFMYRVCPWSPHVGKETLLRALWGSRQRASQHTKSQSGQVSRDPTQALTKTEK